MIVLGCIADDFTGAGDAASFLVKGGLSVRLYNGIPQQHQPADDDVQAIVIALKSRMHEANQAVTETLDAARFLLKQGAQQIYFKYCSTFDSTPAGNIGPAADALLEMLQVPYTLLCPALPVNGRTVEHGRLMVNGIPLDKSHMKNHPLTPMWDSRISQLMAPQSRYACIEIDIDNWVFNLAGGAADTPYYLIPDYQTEEDGRKIAKTFSELRLLTGGSGLLEPLAEIWSQKLSGTARFPQRETRGKALILAGSCSQATLAQIAWYQKQRLPFYKLDPLSMLTGTQTVEDAWRFIEDSGKESDTVLIYSSETPENIKKAQQCGVQKTASILEHAFAQLAVRAVGLGYTRIISAGGETSGAITGALGFSSYLIGECVASGVPIMVPAEYPNLRLVLKSGNFGQEDFFIRALKMTVCNEEDNK